ncbi:hypothetical protein HK097_000066 [Rhizophlyctis rosea]|uniref:Nitrate reductase [NADPH] n=1 Tax=Rhizophlyctis rosea TaxID=64517 RepID=A0AAD5SN01_9FUNG|nr:hypothetical protein HK097_000066 [Rhizophlyctis rosea]
MRAFFDDLHGDDVVGVAIKDGQISVKHRADIPKAKIFTRHEVSLHTTPSTGIWIIHNQGVYDITRFIPIHPGGSRILLAAGKSIDPFWSVFSIHHTPETYSLLEEYRIGDLAPDGPSDLSAIEEMQKSETEALAKLFGNDPERDERLIVRSERPFNAETRREDLRDSFVTPNHLHYKRNHLPVPVVDEEEFALEIEGPHIEDGFRLSIKELKERFEKADVMVALQCAGNRRKDMTTGTDKPVKGLPWEEGAISNAVWSGVYLRDVLAAAGYPVKEYEKAHMEGVEHVQFDGLDGYGASIPATTAMDPQREVLLAYEMNGEPIPPDHGGVLRVVVPGTVAARSVKWVNKIALSDEESWSHWQRHDYKGFSPSATQETSDYEKAESIQDMPVQSAILDVSERDNRTVHMQGYAWSGAGHGIVRVDVSADGGKTWMDAELHVPPQDRNRRWAWTKWEATVKLPKGVKETELVCKAVDTGYNTQPETVDSIYNVRGVLNSAWHRVRIPVGETGGLDA